MEGRRVLEEGEEGEVEGVMLEILHTDGVVVMGIVDGRSQAYSVVLSCAEV